MAIKYVRTQRICGRLNGLDLLFSCGARGDNQVIIDDEKIFLCAKHMREYIRNTKK